DIDPDNACGVDGSTHVTVSQIGWLTFDADGNVVAGKITGEVTAVFTANDGRSAPTHVAGPSSFSVTDNGDRTLTVVNTWKGLPEQVRGGGGGVATFDAGLLTLVRTFDVSGPNPVLVSSEIVAERGPHPEADAGFAIFCNAFLAALG